jgi:hypothetical protein
MSKVSPYTMATVTNMLDHHSRATLWLSHERPRLRLRKPIVW